LDKLFTHIVQRL